MNDTTTSTSQQPPPSGQLPPLVRPRHDRVIAGVAAGLAARLGIGTGWVRAAFVVATFFGGTGILLYIVGWLAIPEEGESASIAASKVSDLEDSSRWIGIALIVLGGLLVLGWTGAVRGELIWAAALVLVGVLLYRGELPSVGRSTNRAEPPSASGSPPPPTPPPPPPPASPPEAPEVPEAGGDPGVVDPPSPPTAATPPAPPPVPSSTREPRPRSILGRLTLATMLIAVGVLAILDNAEVVDPAARHYVGTVVAVAGLGLIVGAWFGRSRGLIALGILLLPVMLVTSVVRVPFAEGAGERTFRPVAAEAVEAEYRLGAGELTIDLADVSVDAGIVGFEATVGAGSLLVIVPDDATVYVDGRVGFGELEVLGATRSGIGREITMSPSPDADAYFDLDVEVGFGELRIVRDANAGGRR